MPLPLSTKTSTDSLSPGGSADRACRLPREARVDPGAREARRASAEGAAGQGGARQPREVAVFVRVGVLVFFRLSQQEGMLLFCWSGLWRSVPRVLLKG